MYFGNFYNPLDDLAELYKSYDQVVRVPAKVGPKTKSKFTKKRVYRKVSKSSFRYNALESLANLYDIPYNGKPEKHNESRWHSDPMSDDEKSDCEVNERSVLLSFPLMESPEREDDESYSYDPRRRMPEDDYSWQGAEMTDDTSGMWRDSGEPDETEETSEYMPTPKRQHIGVSTRNGAKSSDLLPQSKRNPTTRFRLKDSRNEEPDSDYMKRKESAHCALQSLLERLKRDGELGSLVGVDEEFGKHSKQDLTYLPKETTKALLKELRGFRAPNNAIAKLKQQALTEIEQLTAWRIPNSAVQMNKRLESQMEMEELPNLPFGKVILD